MIGGLFRLVAYGAQDRYLYNDINDDINNLDIKRKQRLDNEDCKKRIKELKVLVKQHGNQHNLHELATKYEDIGQYDKMMECFSLYINKCKHNKMIDFMDLCKNKKNISQFRELYDKCLTILYDNSEPNECPICFLPNAKYKTSCCKQYFHFTCVGQCTSCPLCRNKEF